LLSRVMGMERAFILVAVQNGYREDCKKKDF